MNLVEDTQAVRVVCLGRDDGGMTLVHRPVWHLVRPGVTTGCHLLRWSLTVVMQGVHIPQDVWHWHHYKAATGKVSQGRCWHWGGRATDDTTVW